MTPEYSQLLELLTKANVLADAISDSSASDHTLLVREEIDFSKRVTDFLSENGFG